MTLVEATEVMGSPGECVGAIPCAAGPCLPSERDAIRLRRALIGTQ